MASGCSSSLAAGAAGIESARPVSSRTRTPGLRENVQQPTSGLRHLWQDARGHDPFSERPGLGGSFACLVRDADCFVKHVSREYEIPLNHFAVMAHTSAVVAAAWVHDYAPQSGRWRSRSACVKLYVPFAVLLAPPAHFQKKAFVRTRAAGMLTHDATECEYARIR
jgi:hypothetical protein